MPFDGLVLKNITDEINLKAMSGIIYKITQPEKEKIILRIKNNREKHYLLIDLNLSRPRIHFTSQKYENPNVPYNFCESLRKHLSGAKILSACQIGLDRICKIEIESYIKVGVISKYFLFVEIMGRYSNIIFTDEFYKIINASKHIDFSTSSVRQILPKLKYELPNNQNKINPLTATVSEVKKIFSDVAGQEAFASQILKKFEGISPKSAHEIVMLHFHKNKNFDNFSETFVKFFESISNLDFCCLVIIDKEKNKKIDFLCLSVKIQDENFVVKEFDFMSEALDFFYEEKSSGVECTDKYKNVLKILKKNIKRCERKILIFQKALEECHNKDKYKIFANLIFSNIGKIKKGLSEILVNNYYLENLEEIKISLKKDLTPKQNAMHYYKLYNKLKNANKHCSEQLKLCEDEKKYLELVHFSVIGCTKLGELDEICLELRQEGYIKSKAKKKCVLKTKPLEVDLNDKTKILIGKNNKQNDYLTFKMAFSTDLWFHAKDVPGSHVLLKSQDNLKVSEEFILHSAMLAAYFSKARESTKVLVDYTKIKNVKKIKGARTGMVVYDNYKTICVSIDKNFILSILEENPK